MRKNEEFSIIDVLQETIDELDPGAQRDRIIKLKQKVQCGEMTVKELVPEIIAEVHHSLLSFADMLSEYSDELPKSDIM